MERNEQNLKKDVEMLENVVIRQPFPNTLGQWNTGVQYRPILGRQCVTSSTETSQQETKTAQKMNHESEGSRPLPIPGQIQYKLMPEPQTRKKFPIQALLPPGTTYCSFCIQNQETKQCWNSHKIKDRKTGIVTCPVLRCHVCQFCGATGDWAHTEAYCPKQPIGRSIATALKMTPRNSTGLRDRKRF